MLIDLVFAVAVLALLVLPALVMSALQEPIRQRHGDDAVHGLEEVRTWQRRIGLGQVLLCLALVGICLHFAGSDEQASLLVRTGHAPGILAVTLMLVSVLGGAFMVLASRGLTVPWTGATWRWWHHLRYVLFWQWMFLGRGPALVYGIAVIAFLDTVPGWLAEHRMLVWLGASLLLGGLYAAQLLLTPRAVRLLFAGERAEGDLPVRRFRYRSYGSRLPLAFAGGLFPSSSSITFNDALEDVLDPDEFEAVLLHEYSHILRRDVWNRLSVVLRGIAFTSVAGFVLVEIGMGEPTLGLVAAVLAPFGGVLLSTVVLRRRYWDQEIEADAFAAEAVGVETYGGALIKIHDVLRLPAEWSSGDRSRAMHPSLRQRLNEIGYKAPVPAFAGAGFSASAETAPALGRVLLEFHPVLAAPPPAPQPRADDIPPRYRPRYRYSPPLRPDRR